MTPARASFSARRNRRLAFCLLRDRKPAEVKKPARINRANCPAGPN